VKNKEALKKKETLKKKSNIFFSFIKMRTSVCESMLLEYA